MVFYEPDRQDTREKLTMQYASRDTKYTICARELSLGFFWALIKTATVVIIWLENKNEKIGGCGAVEKVPVL